MTESQKIYLEVISDHLAAIKGNADRLEVETLPEFKTYWASAIRDRAEAVQFCVDQFVSLSKGISNV